MPFSLNPACSEHCEQDTLLHYLTTSCETFKCSLICSQMLYFGQIMLYFEYFVGYFIDKLGPSPSCYTLWFGKKYFGYIS